MNKRLIMILVAVLLVPMLLLAAFDASPMYAQTGSDTATPTANQTSTVTAQVTPSATATTSSTATSTSASGPVVPAEAVAALQGTLEQIYNQVGRSVVSIQVVGNLSGGNQTVPSTPNAPLPNPGAPQLQQALGSGFVWDTQGHIVTNNHVVDGASRIAVTFFDGTTITATVTGRDVNSDLAVLKVDAPAGMLTPVVMGNSDQLKVGQLVVAIGNPFGEAGTMTTGIVSALARSLPVGGSNTEGPTYSIPDVIQTDASINPGNSGGVLTDATGSVVGVTSAIESSTRSSSGVGFAIPSAIVREVVPSLISSGSYQWPYLGISGTSLVPELASAMALTPTQRGALVIDVVPGGPADQAGVHGSQRQVTIDGQQAPVGGDVITAIDNSPVKTFDDLVTYLARSTKVGQTVTLTVLRDGKSQDIDVTLGARPNQVTPSGQPAATPQAMNTPMAGATPEASATPQSGTTPQASATPQAGTTPEASATPQAGGPVRLGVLAVNMTPEIAQAMNLPSNQTGVLIERVEQGSAADQAGLQGSFRTVTIGQSQVLVGGDVITGLNGQDVTDISGLQAMLQQQQPNSEVTLDIIRGGQQMQVTVNLGQSGTATP